MKTKEIENKPISVSPILQTADKNGGYILGFTVFKSDGSFYNVVRSCSVQDYDSVLAETTAERQAVTAK